MSEIEDHEDDYPETPEDPNEKVLDKLEDVQSTLEEIRDRIPNVSSNNFFWFFVVVFIFWTWIGPALGRFDRWSHKVWYSMRYSADFKNIAILKEPSDCNFFHAPLGDKGCSYKKHVEPFGDEQRQELLQQATTPEARQEIQNRPNSVFVYWEKKED